MYIRAFSQICNARLATALILAAFSVVCCKGNSAEVKVEPYWKKAVVRVTCKTAADGAVERTGSGFVIANQQNHFFILVPASVVDRGEGVFQVAETTFLSGTEEEQKTAATVVAFDRKIGWAVLRTTTTARCHGLRPYKATETEKGFSKNGFVYGQTFCVVGLAQDAPPAGRPSALEETAIFRGTWLNAYGLDEYMEVTGTRMQAGSPLIGPYGQVVGVLTERTGSSPDSRLAVAGGYISELLAGGVTRITFESMGREGDSTTLRIRAECFDPLCVLKQLSVNVFPKAQLRAENRAFTCADYAQQVSSPLQLQDGTFEEKMLLTIQTNVPYVYSCQLYGTPQRVPFAHCGPFVPTLPPKP